MNVLQRILNQLDHLVASAVRQIEKRIGFIRITAVVTTICFVWSSIISQGLYAMVDMNQHAARVNTVLDDCLIPYTAGRICDARFLGSETVVINIQDLHCHAEVQRNIARILGILDEKYNLQKVYIEGGSGNLDTSWINLLDSKEKKESVLETLLAAGRLTGTEYYSIKSGKYQLLSGIENKAVYDANIKRLGEILAQKEEIEAALPVVKARLDALKQRYFCARNQRLESLIARNRNGEIGAEKYFKSMFKLLEKTGGDSAAYPAIAEMLNIVELQRSMNYRRISKEMQRFIASLKQRLPYTAYASLMEKAKDPQKLDELYLALSRISKEYSMNVADSFPGLAQFFAFVEMNQKINALDLVAEERQLIRSLHASLSLTNGEREVAFLSDSFTLVEEYLSSKIAAKDYAILRENMPVLQVMWSKYISTDGIPELARYYELFDTFYDVNVERNALFVKNILPDVPEQRSADVLVPAENQADQVIQSLKNAKNIIVVVTGGFHTAGVSTLLQQRNLSYLVITPNVTQDTKFSDMTYQKLARQQARIAQATLALMTMTEALRAAGDDVAKIQAIDTTAVTCSIENIITAYPNLSPQEIVDQLNKDFNAKKWAGTIEFISQTDTKIIFKCSLDNIETTIVYDKRAAQVQAQRTSAKKGALVLNSSRQRMRIKAVVRVAGEQAVDTMPLTAMVDGIADLLFASVPTKAEQENAVKYFRGETATAVIDRPWRPSKKEDVPDINDFTPEQRSRYEKLGIQSLLDGAGSIQRLAAGSSSRMNVKDAPSDVKALLTKGTEIHSKAAVPLGVTEHGDVVTYLGEFAFGTGRLLKTIEQEARKAGKSTDGIGKNDLLLFTNDEYAPEHKSILEEHDYFGLPVDSVRFMHQPTGAKYVATVKDVENLRAKFSSEEQYRIALERSRRAEEEFKKGNTEALIYPGERGPLGHGEFFHQMIVSGELLHLIDTGKKWCFISNIDNAGVKFDKEWLIMLGYFIDNGLDFQPEVSIRTPGQSGGNLIVMTDNGAQRFVEDPSIRATIDALVRKQGISDPADIEKIKKEATTYWFNDAVAFFTPHYVIDLYKKDGQSDEEFIEELRLASAAEREAIVERVRSASPAIYDAKPAKNSIGATVVRETNMWQTTGMVRPDIKIKAIGVRGPRNIDMREYPSMPWEKRMAVLAQLRFLSAKQWDVSPAVHDASKKNLEEILKRPVTDEELYVTLETYHGNKLLVNDILHYNREAEIVTPGILKDKSIEQSDTTVATSITHPINAGVSNALLTAVPLAGPLTTTAELIAESAGNEALLPQNIEDENVVWEKVYIAQDPFAPNWTNGTSGVRLGQAPYVPGKSKDLGFTRGNMLLYGQAIANVGKMDAVRENKQLKELRYAVGYDARPNGKAFAILIQEVLAANGIHIDLIGEDEYDTLTSPGAAALSDQYDRVFIITCSHNPMYMAEEGELREVLWGGIKTMANGTPAPKSITDELDKEVKRLQEHLKPLKDAQGEEYYIFPRMPSETIPDTLTTRGIDATSQELQRMFSVFDVETLAKNIENRRLLPGQEDFGVFGDAMYGAGGKLMKSICSTLGVAGENDLIRLEPMSVAYKTKRPEAEMVEGKREPFAPNPGKDRNRLLISKCKEFLAKLGIAYDGDVDRFFCDDVDPNHTLIEPDDLAYIFTDYLHTYMGVEGSVVFTLVTNHELRDYAENNNIPYYMTPVGSSNFSPHVQLGTDRTALGAFESSGHMFVQIVNQKTGQKEMFVDSAPALTLLTLTILSDPRLLDQGIFSLTDYIKDLRRKSKTEMVSHTGKVDATAVKNAALDFNAFKTALSEMRTDENAVKEFAQRLGAALHKEVVDFDAKTDKNGIKVYFSDGSWAMYRLSGTDGSVRLHGQVVVQRSQAPENEDATARDLREENDRKFGYKDLRLQEDVVQGILIDMARNRKGLKISKNTITKNYIPYKEFLAALLVMRDKGFAYTEFADMLAEAVKKPLKEVQVTDHGFAILFDDDNKSIAAVYVDDEGTIYYNVGETDQKLASTYNTQMHDLLRDQVLKIREQAPLTVHDKIVQILNKLKALQVEDKAETSVYALFFAFFENLSKLTKGENATLGLSFIYPLLAKLRDMLGFTSKNTSVPQDTTAVIEGMDSADAKAFIREKNAEYAYKLSERLGLDHYKSITGEPSNLLMSVLLSDMSRITIECTGNTVKLTVVPSKTSDPRLLAIAVRVFLEMNEKVLGAAPLKKWAFSSKIASALLKSDEASGNLPFFVGDGREKTSPVQDKNSSARKEYTHHMDYIRYYPKQKRQFFNWFVNNSWGISGISHDITGYAFTESGLVFQLENGITLEIDRWMLLSPDDEKYVEGNENDDVHIVISGGTDQEKDKIAERVIDRLKKSIHHYLDEYDLDGRKMVQLTNDMDERGEKQAYKINDYTKAAFLELCHKLQDTLGYSAFNEALTKALQNKIVAASRVHSNGDGLTVVFHDGSGIVYQLKQNEIIVSVVNAENAKRIIESDEAWQALYNLMTERFEAGIVRQKLLEKLPQGVSGLFGVPAGSAILGAFAQQGDEGYFVVDNHGTQVGKDKFLRDVALVRAFLKRHPKLVAALKLGIGGQHTPFEAIADMLSDGEIRGLYELGIDYEQYLEIMAEELDITWDQIAIIPSSKSGTTDETMTIFSKLLYCNLAKAAAESGIDGKKFSNTVFSLLHTLCLQENGEEKPTDELFKTENGLIEYIYTHLPDDLQISQEQIKDAFLSTVSIMLFETTNNKKKSRLAAFIANSGLEKELGEDAKNFIEMFNNVGGRWTGDLHMIFFLAYYDRDGKDGLAEKYWNERRRTVTEVNAGTHPSVKIGNMIADENIKKIALLVPDDMESFGIAIEQNFNESIWQGPEDEDGCPRLTVIKKSNWDVKKHYYKGEQGFVIDLTSDVDLDSEFRVYHRYYFGDFKGTTEERVLALANLFGFFYGMTSTVGDRLIARALLKKNMSAKDIDFTDANNPVTQTVLANLYTLQRNVELGKKLLEDELNNLQKELLTDPEAINKRAQKAIDDGAKGVIASNLPVEYPMPEFVKDQVSLIAAMREAKRFADSEGRAFVPMVYLEGDKAKKVIDALNDLGFEHVLQGTRDQHINIQQEMEQPGGVVLFIISFVPKDLETMGEGLPSNGLVRNYLNMVPDALVRHIFAKKTYEAHTVLVNERRKAEGLPQNAYAVICSLSDTPANINKVIKAGRNVMKYTGQGNTSAPRSFWGVAAAAAFIAVAYALSFWTGADVVSMAGAGIDALKAALVVPGILPGTGAHVHAIACSVAIFFAVPESLKPRLMRMLRDEKAEAWLVPSREEVVSTKTKAEMIEDAIINLQSNEYEEQVAGLNILTNMNPTAITDDQRNIIADRLIELANTFDRKTLIICDVLLDQMYYNDLSTFKEKRKAFLEKAQDNKNKVAKRYASDQLNHTPKTIHKVTSNDTIFMASIGALSIIGLSILYKLGIIAALFAQVPMASPVLGVSTIILSVVCVGMMSSNDDVFTFDINQYLGFLHRHPEIGINEIFDNIGIPGVDSNADHEEMMRLLQNNTFRYAVDIDKFRYAMNILKRLHASPERTALVIDKVLSEKTLDKEVFKEGIRYLTLLGGKHNPDNINDVIKKMIVPRLHNRTYSWGLLNTALWSMQRLEVSMEDIRKMLVHAKDNTEDAATRLLATTYLARYNWKPDTTSSLVLLIGVLSSAVAFIALQGDGIAIPTSLAGLGSALLPDWFPLAGVVVMLMMGMVREVVTPSSEDKAYSQRIKEAKTAYDAADGSIEDKAVALRKMAVILQELRNKPSAQQWIVPYKYSKITYSQMITEVSDEVLQEMVKNATAEEMKALVLTLGEIQNMFGTILDKRVIEIAVLISTLRPAEEQVYCFANMLLIPRDEIRLYALQQLDAMNALYKGTIYTLVEKTGMNYPPVRNAFMQMLHSKNNTLRMRAVYELVRDSDDEALSRLLEFAQNNPQLFTPEMIDEITWAFEGSGKIMPDAWRTPDFGKSDRALLVDTVNSALNSLLSSELTRDQRDQAVSRIINSVDYLDLETLKRVLMASNIIFSDDERRRNTFVELLTKIVLSSKVASLDVKKYVIQNALTPSNNDAIEFIISHARQLSDSLADEIVTHMKNDQDHYQGQYLRLLLVLAEHPHQKVRSMAMGEILPLVFDAIGMKELPATSEKRLQALTKHVGKRTKEELVHAAVKIFIFYGENPPESIINYTTAKDMKYFEETLDLYNATPEKKYAVYAGMLKGPMEVKVKAVQYLCNLVIKDPTSPLAGQIIDTMISTFASLTPREQLDWAEKVYDPLIRALNAYTPGDARAANEKKEQFLTMALGSSDIVTRAKATAAEFVRRNSFTPNESAETVLSSILIMVVAAASIFLLHIGTMAIACVDTLLPFAGGLLTFGALAGIMVGMTREVRTSPGSGLSSDIIPPSADKRPHEVQQTGLSNPDAMVRKLVLLNERIGILSAKVDLTSDEQSELYQKKAEADELFVLLNDHAVIPGTSAEKIEGIDQVIGNAAKTSYTAGSLWGFAVGALAWKESLKFVGAEEQVPLAVSMKTGLANKNWVCSYSKYDEEIVKGRGRVIAGMGITPFIITALPENKKTSTLINVSKRYSLVTDDAGENQAAIWAERSKEHIYMIYYEMKKGNDTARVQQLVARLLEDNPGIARDLGAGDRQSFAIDVFESDQQGYNPAIAEKGNTLSTPVTVFVHNSIIEAQLNPVTPNMQIDNAAKTEKNTSGVPSSLAAGYVRITKDTEVFESFKAVGSEYRRKQKARGEQMKGRPTSTFRLDVRGDFSANKYLKEALALNPSAVVLPDLWQGRETLTEKELNEVARFVDILRQNVDAQGVLNSKSVIIDYTISSQKDIDAMEERIRPVVRQGIAGVRVIIAADASVTATEVSGAIDRVGAFMQTVKGAPQLWLVTSGVFSGNYEKPGVKRAMIIEPATASLQDVSAFMKQQGVWVEISAQGKKYAGNWHGLEAFIGEFKKEAGATDMIGTDAAFLKEGAKVLKAHDNTKEFVDVIAELFAAHLEVVLKENPAYRQDNEFRKVMDAEQYDILSPEQLSAAVALLKNKDEALVQGFVRGAFTSSAYEAALRTEIAGLQSADRDQLKIAAAAVRGNLKGAVARSMMPKYVDEINRPFSNNEDRLAVGQMIVLAMICDLPALPENWLALSYEEQQDLFETMIAGIAAHDNPQVLDARKTNSQLRHGAAMVDVGPQMNRCVNALTGAVDTSITAIESSDNPGAALEEQKKGALPAEIAELLRLMIMYADRDERSLQRVRKEVLDKLPAVIKAMNAAA